LELKYKSYERNKKTEKENKRNLSQPDRSRPSRPNIRAAPCGGFYPPLGHGQPARALLPLIFLLFF
jgi:hypothetical protein